MALTQKQQALEGFVPTKKSGNVLLAQAPAQQEVVKPAASPVNTYVPPAAVEQAMPRSPLLDLASGLKGLDRGLDSIVSARTEQYRKDQEKKDRADGLKAVEDFYKRDGMSTADAVRKGLIPPDASPAYMEASKEQEGTVKGRQLVSEIEDAYATWEGRHTADAATFGKWLSGEVKKRVDGVNDQYVLKGMIPHIERMRGQLSTLHSNEKSKAVYNRTLDTAAAEVGDVVETQLKRDPTGGTFDPKKAAAEIETTSQKLLAVGVKPADLNKTIVDAVTAKAIADNNPELLDVLMQRRSDGQRGPGETAYGKKEIAEAKDKIFNQAVRLDGIVHTREEREKKRIAGLATRKAIDLLAKDPYGDIPAEIIALGTEADPDFAAKVDRLRGTFAAKDSREDPNRAREAEIRIYKSESPFDTAVQEIEAGNIRNPITVGRLLDRTSAIQKSREKGEAGILKMPAVGRYRKLLEKQLTEGDPYNVEGYAQSNRAIGDMEARLAEWEMKNPRATAAARNQAVERIGEEIRGAIDADRQYNREQVRQLPAPQPEQQKAAAPQKAPASVAPAEPVEQQDGAATQPEPEDAVKIIQARIKALDSMGGKFIGKVKVGKGSKEIESAIAKAAKKHGVDAETLRGIAWLESTFDGNAKNGNSSAGGLFQFIDTTAAQYKLTDKFNVDESADAAARLLIDNTKALQPVLGRKPTSGELYLAHQQGAGGALILLRQPNMKAVDALSKLKGVSAAEAKERIRLNLPERIRHRANDISAGEFAKLWTSKLDG